MSNPVKSSIKLIIDDTVICNEGYPNTDSTIKLMLDDKEIYNSSLNKFTNSNDSKYYSKSLYFQGNATEFDKKIPIISKEYIYFDASHDNKKNLGSFNRVNFNNSSKEYGFGPIKFMDDVLLIELKFDNYTFNIDVDRLVDDKIPITLSEYLKIEKTQPDYNQKLIKLLKKIFNYNHNTNSNLPDMIGGQISHKTRKNKSIIKKSKNKNKLKTKKNINL